VPRRSADATRVAALYRSIYAVIRRIPKGRVATYGQVAEVAGIPRGARIAAAALKVSGGRVPWQRVCGKASRTRARIAILDPIGAAMQRALLEAEGVEIGDAGLIDLGAYGWLPTVRAAPSARGTRRWSRPDRSRRGSRA
jgi:methylated-DNA-protein-cysteine methyltransferase-like protein